MRAEDLYLGLDIVLDDPETAAAVESARVVTILRRVSRPWPTRDLRLRRSPKSVSGGVFSNEPISTIRTVPHSLKGIEEEEGESSSFSVKSWRSIISDAPRWKVTRSFCSCQAKMDSPYCRRRRVRCVFVTLARQCGSELTHLFVNFHQRTVGLC